MASKKSNLADALQQVSGKPAIKANKAELETQTQTTPANNNSRDSYLAPSRKGKKAVTGFFDPAVSKQLKQIALDRDTTVQALLGEALNDLFQKYDKSPIA